VKMLSSALKHMKTTAMNKILITLALLFSSSLLMADAQQPSNRTVIGETCQITVRVAELQQPEGLLGVALYTTKKGFPTSRTGHGCQRSRSLTALCQNLCLRTFLMELTL